MVEPYYFCTYFDRNYLTRGLALYHSLVQHCPHPFSLWILCFDDETWDILSRLALSQVRLISRQEFETTNARLLQIKNERTLVEYYWTCTPALLLYILEQNPRVGLVTYLDADLYFFSAPRPIYDELGDGSILLIEHRFPPDKKELERFGIYNVGVMVFRGNATGLSALHWWNERCIEWCYARVEGDKFGDQKYLDDWRARFPGVVVLQHKGAGLAPWNIMGYSITNRNGRVWVDGEPLVFYHFHSMQWYGAWVYKAAKRGWEINSDHKRWLYEPYLCAINSATNSVKSIRRDFRTSVDVPIFSKLRAVLDYDFDVLGATPYLFLLREVYRTMQEWYRQVRYEWFNNFNVR